MKKYEIEFKQLIKKEDDISIESLPFYQPITTYPNIKLLEIILDDVEVLLKENNAPRELTNEERTKFFIEANMSCESEEDLDEFRSNWREKIAYFVADKFMYSLLKFDSIDFGISLVKDMYLSFEEDSLST